MSGELLTDKSWVDPNGLKHTIIEKDEIGSKSPETYLRETGYLPRSKTRGILTR